ncbi:NUDIX domain-containing protein [Candidatus Leptofilum sp.]|uniref:NUDIX domain-containing protein n=1 Tax=Candidatus Leptofilum sp. TaxID=3241576 RepID=UPI003B5BD1F8
MTIHKVTAFITREQPEGRQLLLFQHPQAGVQIPAGTVDAGEDWQTAVLREATEETGLTQLTIHRYLGKIENELAAGEAILNQDSYIFSQPDKSSLPFAPLFSRGMTFEVGEQAAHFHHTTYTEYDQLPNPTQITLYIDGWLPSERLSWRKTRHYAHLHCHKETPYHWTLPSDRSHTFAPFWVNLQPKPTLIVQPQNRWLDDVYAALLRP